MECPDQETIMMVLDGEFPDPGGKIGRHLEGCSVCREVANRFAWVGDQVRGSLSGPGEMEIDERLQALLLSEDGSIWKRRWWIPVPLVVAAAVLVVAISSWATYATFQMESAGRRVRFAQTPTVGSPSDLVRLDSRGKAVVFTEPVR